MTKNHDQSVEINDIPNWPYIPNHPHRILIICRSGLIVSSLFIYQRPIRIKVSIAY